MQLSFKIKDGEHSDDFITEAQYQSALAASGWLHRFTAWVWDGMSLKVKNVPQGEDEESCHHTLFGDMIYRSPFRGWFNPHSRILSFMSRERDVIDTCQIPERLYRRLIERFGKDVIIKTL